MTLRSPMAAADFAAALTLAQSGGTFWMPPRASTTAGEVDWLFYFIFYVAAFFFVLIVALMFFFIIRYRRCAGAEVGTTTHNTPLELIWSIIPLILVCVMFWGGFRVYMNMRTPPDAAYQVNVIAQQWKWQFEYPNGWIDDVLHVPVDTPVRLVMESKDVIHSLYVPDFRVKMDVVPGRYTRTWFQATEPGEHLLLCAEYCGTSHSDMRSMVVVHPPGEFERWLENADPLKRLSPEQYEEYLKNPGLFIQKNPDFKGLQPPAELGRSLYVKRGCGQCHTVDGKPATGPTFQGLWGKTEVLRDGTRVAVDENYIRESILEPNAKIVAGYEALMPTYQGRIKDREITAIIAYLKLLRP